MTTEQVQESTNPIDTVSEEVNSYFAKLNEEANNEYKAELEYIMRNDEVETHDGIYTLVKVIPDTKIEFKKLQEDMKGLDSNSQDYYDNLCKRACLLIKDFTKEKFKECDVEAIEKIVVAWSARAFNGFRPSIKRPT